MGGGLSSAFSGCWRRVFEAASLNWADASNKCEQLGEGWMLAKVDSSEQNTALTAAFGVLDNPYRGYWIGANDRVQESTYVNTDGSALAFTSWSPAGNEEPSNSDDEDCVTVHDISAPWHAGNWWDITCDAQLPYACSMQLPN